MPLSQIPTSITSHALKLILEKAGVTVQNELLQLESFGYLLDQYVITGAVLTATVGQKSFSLSEAVISFNDTLWKVPAFEGTTGFPNVTYYIAFTESGFQVDIALPSISHLALWTIATDANGAIASSTDTRGTTNMVRFKIDVQGVVPEVITAANDATTVANAAAATATQSNTDFTAAESLRVTAEDGRVTAEGGRVSAEDGRVTAETARVTAESGRVTAEDNRVAAESSRVTAEGGRVTAETARDSAEDGRATAETSRVAAENGRVTAESERVTAEAARVVNESTRANNEVIRQTNETARQAAITTQNAAIDAQNARIDNIVGDTGDSTTEIVDARLGADSVARATLGTLVREIHAKMIEAATVSAALTHGLQQIIASQAGPVIPTVYGRTLVNLLGKDGNCESLTPFTTSGTVALSTTWFNSGTKSIKLGSGDSFIDANYSKLDTSKYYVIAAWFYIESYSAGTVTMRIYEENDLGTVRYYNNANTSIVGTKQLVYVKIPTSNTIVSDGFTLYLGVTDASTAVTYVDSIRLYELSATDYTAIGTTYTTDAAIDGFIPYVDSVQHVLYPAVRLAGKNLLPPFTEWTVNSHAIVMEPYKLQLNATASTQESYCTLSVLPNTTYVVQFASTDAATGSFTAWILTEEKDANGVVTKTKDIWLSLPTDGSAATKSFTTKPTTATLTFTCGNFAGGTWIYNHPQLELGSTATTWEAKNDDYIYLKTDAAGNPLKLGSDVGRTVCDTVTPRDGQWWLTRRWVKDVALDGSFGWSLDTDQAGYKILKLSKFSDAVVSMVLANSKLVKYDGKILLPYVATASGADGYRQINTDASFFITVSDTDSGWTETLIPNTNAIKGLMNGWKANGNDGSVYNSWVSVLDGSVPGTNTEAFVAANKATGWTGWATLSYQLAVSTEEIVNVEGSISVHAGGNQAEVLEGVIDREPANPVLRSENDFYLIDDIRYATTNRLKNKSEKIIAVYKNGVMDNKWQIITDFNAFGKQRAALPIAEFDPTAQYTVTYEIYSGDKYKYTANLAKVDVVYQSNPRMSIDDLSKAQSDMQTALTIIDGLLDSTYTKSGGKRIQIGTANGTIVTPGTAVTVAVTFPIAYASAPEIKLALKSSAGGTAGYINIFAESVTTTGFTLRLNAYVAGAISVGWEAIGK